MALRCMESLAPVWRARGVRLLGWQLEAAERILAMGGQGILADEVGLGKTVEAGLVMRELMDAGECRSVLVLCPASLCRQWERELREKFDLTFVRGRPGHPANEGQAAEGGVVGPSVFAGPGGQVSGVRHPSGAGHADEGTATASGAPGARRATNAVTGGHTVPGGGAAPAASGAVPPAPCARPAGTGSAASAPPPSPGATAATEVPAAAPEAGYARARHAAVTAAAPASGGPGPDLVILSIDVAKRPETRAALAARTWDLVVVDEAHKLKNRQTQNHRLVAALPRRRLLLLSATPLQNDLTELYALVSLVRPGLFGSFQGFWRQFLLDRRTPRDPSALRQLLAGVMVRHRRHDLPAAEALPQREVALLPVRLTPEERRLYDGVTSAVRREYWRRAHGEGTVLPLITLQREVCSSAAAVRRSLTAMEGADSGAGWLGGDPRGLRALAEAVREQAKARVLQGLVGALGERALVFTEFRATQEYLAAVLTDAGLPVLLFHGGQQAAERDRVVRRFWDEPRAVLVATESGGEGLNLQVCRHVINYDLPWNPMRVEQRIGRAHRVGQTSAVHVYNLYAEGTIEEHLIRLLDEKINLFRQVVGELDVILRRLEAGGRRSLESRVAEILWQSESEREMAWRFEELGRTLLRQRRLASGREALLAPPPRAAGEPAAP